ncbi:MAG: hypothetical protein UCN44_09660 [Enterocloster sp.]|nr:hypothetical protein [Enterocloster sp.]
MSEEIIKQLFKSYVDSKCDMEYHSKECVDAERAMTDLVYKYVKDDNAALEIILAAINLAGKYEENGYVAGFKREPLTEAKAVA